MPIAPQCLCLRDPYPSYSFATWRFHLRGEGIRSAHDIGWIRNLTVDKLMRSDVKTAQAAMTLEEFRKDFPLGSTQRVIVIDENDKYVGMILTPARRRGTTPALG